MTKLISQNLIPLALLMRLLLQVRSFSILFLVVVLLTSVGLVQADADAQKNIPAYKVVSIQAYLYFDQKGTFSENIIDNPRYGKGALWNTNIGAGSAQNPSDATMVVVEIAGAARSYESKRKVELRVTENEKVKLRRISRIGILSNDGKYFAAFWLYDTGCLPIKLNAKILGQSQSETIDKQIDFQCGE